MRRRTPVWLWLVPVLTVGIFAVVAPLAIAVKKQTRTAWLWLAGSGVATILAFALLNSAPQDSPRSNLGAAVAIINLIASLAYSLPAAKTVAWGRAADDVPAQPVMNVDPNRAALAAAQAERKKRADARALVTKDPDMARDLRIGRPDLPRQYDDGGLVDINSVPADVFVRYLGLTPAQAGQIVDARTKLGKFLSPDDLTSYAEIDIDTYDRIKEHLVVV